MSKAVQNKIIQTLTKMGLKAFPITLTDGIGVKIDTDYEGPYPGKKQFEILDMARRKFKNYTVEQRGHYSAVFIR